MSSKGRLRAPIRLSSADLKLFAILADASWRQRDSRQSAPGRKLARQVWSACVHQRMNPTLAFNARVIILIGFARPTRRVSDMATACLIHLEELDIDHIVSNFLRSLVHSLART